MVRYDLLSGILVYVVAMIAIGVYLGKYVRTASDFWLAGRSLGPWLVAFSYVATYFSSVAVVGSAGYIYTKGLAMAVYNAIGSTWMFVVIPLLFLAVPLRKMTERLDCVTMPQLLASRYGSEFMRIMTAAVVAVAYTAIVGTMLIGCARSLAVLVGLPYAWGIILTAGLVAVYVTISGYYAVAWTDFVQGWILAAGVVLTMFLGFVKMGGLSEVVAKLGEIDANLLHPTVGMGGFNFLSFGLVWGFVSLGTPYTLIRFMSIKKVQMLRQALLIAAALALCVIFPIYLNGVIARAAFPTEFLKTPDSAIPSLVQRMLPPWAAVVFIAALLAAAMSSVDSAALVAASCVERDIWADGINRGRVKASEQTNLFLPRLIALIVCVLAALFALKPPSIIFIISSYAGATVAAAMTAPIYYGVFWKRANWQGAVAASVLGLCTTLYWYVFKVPVLHPYLPGVLVSLVALPVVSLLTPPPSREHVIRCFGRGA